MPRLQSFVCCTGKDTDQFQFSLDLPENRVLLLLKSPVSDLSQVKPENVQAVARLDIFMNLSHFNSLFFERGSMTTQVVSTFLTETKNYVVSLIKALVPGKPLAANKINFMLYSEFESGSTKHAEMETGFKTAGMDRHEHNVSHDWLGNTLQVTHSIYRYKFHFESSYVLKQRTVKGYEISGGLGITSGGISNSWVQKPAEQKPIWSSSSGSSMWGSGSSTQQQPQPSVQTPSYPSWGQQQPQQSQQSQQPQQQQPPAPSTSSGWGQNQFNQFQPQQSQQQNQFSMGTKKPTTSSSWGASSSSGGGMFGNFGNFGGK
jgi:hypothetical protein